MKVASLKRNVLMKAKGKKICVFLKPCVEKQDLNFVEPFVGTPEQILNRSLKIVEGLKAIFNTEDFSVKIETLDLTQTLYLDSEILFDSELNEIGKVEDYLNG